MKEASEWTSLRHCSYHHQAIAVDISQNQRLHFPLYLQTNEQMLKQIWVLFNLRQDIESSANTCSWLAHFRSQVTAQPVSIKCRLQTGYKMQTETKPISSSNIGCILNFQLNLH